MQYSVDQPDSGKEPPQKLRASEKGKQKIRQRREDRGWKYNAEDDDSPLKAASLLLEPQKKEWWEQQWQAGERRYAVAPSTWRRFQTPAPGQRIRFQFFDAFCRILDLSWQEVAELDHSELFIAGNPPDLNRFYGRVWYLNKLHEWIVQQRSQLVVIYGQPGMGKTALVRQFVEQVRTASIPAFEAFIWITPELAFSDFFQQQTGSDQPMSDLLRLLKKQNSLIVLDGWMEILELSGHKERTDELNDPVKVLQKLVRQKHSNTLILIDDEKPLIMADTLASVHIMKLEGLGAKTEELESDQQILAAEQLQGTPEELRNFLARYNNPSVLRSVADIVRVVYGGDIAEFLDKASILLPSDFYPDLMTRFNRVWTTLTHEARIIMYGLAIRRESYTIHQLKTLTVVFEIHPNELTEVLYMLMSKQSLVERDENTGEFKLSPVWQKFATQKFVEETLQELIKAIELREFRYSELFFGYLFLPTDANDSQIQLSQTRRIVTPILQGLTERLGDKSKVRQGLEQLLTILQKREKGYGIQNLRTLLTKLNAR